MSSLKFTAMVVSETKPDTFKRELREKTIDELPEGEVLVRVKYSSLNYKDALSASGNRGVTRKYPHTPGIDAAGVVEHSEHEDFAAGDEVIVSCYDLGMNTPGGFGRYIRVPAKWVMPLPAGMTLRESMIYGTAGFTAAQCVYRLSQHPVTPDQGKILVTGATGGVGSMAVAMLAKAGYRVVAATGKVEEESFLRELGAEEILPRAKAIDTSDRMILKGKWAGVVDTVGGPILATAIKSTRYGGAVTCCGNAASPDLPLNVYPFILRGISLIGIDSASCAMEVRIPIWQKLADQWRLPDLEKLVTEISLPELDQYIENILLGKHRGRVILNLDA
ncbi:MAG: YhdH/YhfP family quinone oxidoreductase [Desulfobulbaceae bacterium]|nr:YhdH/YhfP family quinone oxidoreductase [Desulfobulbaceae bacterium]HIJ78407.1 YhdH/YhfP family quinone oxidoreductase [Deltaproteobacteria bacterium]